MLPVIAALLAFLGSLFRSRGSLTLHVLALQHQVAVYKQTVHHPRLHPSDRLFWAWLSRLWPGWQATLAFVQPRTVIAWQQKRFRDHWRRLSQSGTSGRPAVAREVRDLIRNMSRANPLWGSPRIVHIPSDLVVERVITQRKPPEVRICRLRNQSCVGTRPPSTSTPH
jgi:putative transposase